MGGCSLVYLWYSLLVGAVCFSDVEFGDKSWHNVGLIMSWIVFRLLETDEIKMGLTE